MYSPSIHTTDPSLGRMLYVIVRQPDVDERAKLPVDV